MWILSTWCIARVCFVLVSNGEYVPQELQLSGSVKEKRCVFYEELTLCVLFRWNAILKGLNDEWTRVQISVNYTYYVVLLSISSQDLGECMSCATTDSFRILSISSLTNSRTFLRCAVWTAVIQTRSPQKGRHFYTFCKVTPWSWSKMERSWLYVTIVWPTVLN